MFEANVILREPGGVGAACHSDRVDVSHIDQGIAEAVQVVSALPFQAAAS